VTRQVLAKTEKRDFQVIATALFISALLSPSEFHVTVIRTRQTPGGPKFASKQELATMAREAQTEQEQTG
jgi:hypothetical protein